MQLGDLFLFKADLKTAGNRVYLVRVDGADQLSLFETGFAERGNEVTVTGLQNASQTGPSLSMVLSAKEKLEVSVDSDMADLWIGPPQTGDYELSVYKLHPITAAGAEQPLRAAVEVYMAVFNRWKDAYNEYRNLKPANELNEQKLDRMQDAADRLTQAGKAFMTKATQMGSRAEVEQAFQSIISAGNIPGLTSESEIKGRLARLLNWAFNLSEGSFEAGLEDLAVNRARVVAPILPPTAGRIAQERAATVRASTGSARTVFPSDGEIPDAVSPEDGLADAPAGLFKLIFRPESAGLALLLPKEGVQARIIIGSSQQRALLLEIRPDLAGFLLPLEEFDSVESAVAFARSDFQLGSDATEVPLVLSQRSRPLLRWQIETWLRPFPWKPATLTEALLDDVWSVLGLQV